MKKFKELFRDWLEQKHMEMDVVGVSNNAHCCPIANFFRDMGFDEVSVDRRSINLPTTTWSPHLGEFFQIGWDYETPVWVEMFIAAIDDDMDEVQITAKEAQEALEMVS